MAKKGARILLALICSVCKKHNYTTERNKLNRPEKLALNKFCPSCRKQTLHKESSKLK